MKDPPLARRQEWIDVIVVIIVVVAVVVVVSGNREDDGRSLSFSIRLAITSWRRWKDDYAWSFFT